MLGNNHSLTSYGCCSSSNHHGVACSTETTTPSALKTIADEMKPLTARSLHLVAHDIHAFAILKERLNWFLLYIMAILLFVGLNGALLVANFRDQQEIEENYGLLFHLFSFWGVFIFTLVEATLLIGTGVVSRTNKFQSAMILGDVCFSFLSAILFTLDPEIFEIPAHYVEYLIQIPISCVNLIFVNNYASSSRPDNNSSGQARSFLEKGVSLLPVLSSVLQLLFYTEAIHTEMGPERSAHFCEFVNEILNGAFAFSYAIVNYNQWNQELDQHYI